MTRYIKDEHLQVHLVSGLSSKTAPSLAEIQGGDDITGFIRGLSTPLDGSIVDTPDPTSKFNKTTPGTYGGQPFTMELYRDDVQANDTAFNALPRGTDTYAVISRRGGTGADGALQVGDFVDVWHIQVVSRNPTDYGRNEPDGFSVTCAVPDEPTEDVAIVA